MAMINLYPPTGQLALGRRRHHWLHLEFIILFVRFVKAQAFAYFTRRHLFIEAFLLQARHVFGSFTNRLKFPCLFAFIAFDVSRPRNINYFAFVSLIHSLGNCFRVYLWLFSSRLSLREFWSPKLAFLLHQNVIRVIGLDSGRQAGRQTACNSKQQLDLHRFNKLAIYRLMFLSLNIMPSLPHKTRPVTFNLFP